MITPPTPPEINSLQGQGGRGKGFWRKFPFAAPLGPQEQKKHLPEFPGNGVPGGVPGALERAEKGTADADGKGFRRLEGQPPVGLTRWAFLGTLWGETGRVESHLEKPPRSKHSRNSVKQSKLKNSQSSDSNRWFPSRGDFAPGGHQAGTQSIVSRWVEERGGAGKYKTRPCIYS